MTPFSCRSAARLSAIFFAVWTLFPAALGTAGVQEDNSDVAKPGVAATTPALPIKPERTVKFTTDEGTWLSLDVSPDGQTIVFELLGDLYTMPISGGSARAITTGMAFDSQPHFSPDGSRIVFLSDRSGAENVWIARPDGSDLVQITKDEHSDFASPIWTRDGSAVIVARQTELPLGTFELWSYYVKGGAGVQITKAKPRPDARPDEWSHAIGAVLSPDGKYLYYTKRPGFFNVYNVTYPLSQIARRDLATGEEEQITDAEGSGIRPLLSPDGSKLIYGTRYEGETALRIRDLESGEERWLKYPVQHDDQESLFTRDLLPGYAFMPDGNEIVLSYGGKIHRLNIKDGADQIIPFTADVNLPIGPRLAFPERVEQGPVRARLIQQPVQSPDGKRLAFSVLTHVYVMNLPDGKPVRLTQIDEREFQPAWSPDGNWIAYVTWSEKGGQIWKVRAEGQSEPQQLTQIPAYYSEPVWSPDGAQIIALRAGRFTRVAEVNEWGPPPFDTALVWLPSDGGDVHLIHAANGATSPHFGPEKDRIYAYSDGDGLFSMRLDGTDRRSILKVVGKGFSFEKPDVPNAPAADVRISPDGKWAVALVNYQLYVIAAPRFGEAPTVDVFTPSVPVKKLTDIGADYLNWADDGKTITWAVGSTFFRRPLASVSFEPPKERKGEEAAEAVVAAPDHKSPAKASKSNSSKVVAAEEPSTKPAPMLEEASGVEKFDVDLEFPRYKPSGTVVLRGGKVITMRGNEVIENADVVVKENRILAVGPNGGTSVPADAKVIDVTGTTIVPGFVDLHPHWMEVRHSVLDMENWSFLANLAYGVTAGRDPQTSTNDMFAYQDLADTGEMIGPRAYSTGPGIFWDTDFQSYDDTKDYVMKYKKYYRTNYIKSYLVGNRKQRQWVVQACKELGVIPTTEGGIDAKLDLTHFIDGFNNEHSMPIIPLYNDVVQLLVQSQASYTPTLIVAYGGPWAENYFYENTEVHDDPKVRRFIPHNILDERTKRRMWFRKDEQIFPKLAAQDKKIVEAGGNVLIGSHGQLQGIGYNWELWALASGGMSNMDVLRAATIQGAKAMGLSEDIGSIEPGKLADIVVLRKDPLADIHNTNSVRYVMKGGELFDGDTLDEVWPEQKPLPPLWWWNDHP